VVPSALPGQHCAHFSGSTEQPEVKTIAHYLDFALNPPKIRCMQNNDVPRRRGSTRRAFLSASAVTAVAAPIVSQATTANAAQSARAAKSASAGSAQVFDPALRALIGQIDPARIQATIQKLVSFGTRHTASSQTDPDRGIGAATAWVTQQMQSYAAASGGRMTVQQQTFVQPVSNRIPVPTPITNVIATLQGTASPERFYVVTVISTPGLLTSWTSPATRQVPMTMAQASPWCSNSPACSPPSSSPAR
jgi:hypothetical protein